MTNWLECNGTVACDKADKRLVKVCTLKIITADKRPKACK